MDEGVTLIEALVSERDELKATLRALSTRVQELEVKQGKLIENALQHYKSPNPNNCRFELAMHAITEQRNGRKAADALWQEIDAERKQLKAMVGVIGQLEWYVGSTRANYGDYEAQTMLGTYSCRKHDNGQWSLWKSERRLGEDFYPSPEEAKAVAQADYEARIRSAFVTPPQDAVAKAREEEREQAANIGYRTCAETRHVTLGTKVAAAIRAGEGEG
jgi:hypothetical protein